ncbi:hypothetical protein ACMD2_24920 [Ananas comosus]|uniref:DUF7963 domain-containing protein n=1 Tax=Ananas comosus TaxID=4615 RepID=A0A199V4I4_ANACO|nr:hypothetical protein ACMD2_24920 [Ananas comosus]
MASGGDAGGPGPGLGRGWGGGGGAARAAHKRYEGLMTVRTKAIKGKGAWYWAHLEPILVQSSDTGLPKAVKLRCSLCDAVFSASNPSRTASEHLKRGSCPNFTSPPFLLRPGPPPPAPRRAHLLPAPSLLPLLSPHPTAAAAAAAAAAGMSSPPPSSQMLLSPHHHHQHQHQHHQQQQTAIVLSGGKEDLGALQMLEDSVKKLKSPKTPPAPALPKAQADSALALLADWFYESAGGAASSISSVDHPKFRAFLRSLGLPPLSRRDLAGPKLDERFAAARADADARIRDALFFQVASDGWNPPPFSASAAAALALPLPAAPLVSLTVNLPNGTSVFHRAIPVQPLAPSKFAEEVLWDAVLDVSGPGNAQRCAGIVADRFKSKALRSLEGQHHWMVNLSCLLRAFHCLLRDLFRELPLFRTAAANSAKLAAYFNTKSPVRAALRKHQLQELDHSFLLSVAADAAAAADDPAAAGAGSSSFFCSVFAMLEDVLASARALQLAIHDESYKLACLEDPVARETAEMIRDMGFWNDLEAAHELMKLVRDAIRDAEAERPLVGQCLPLWEQLRAKVKDWCAKFGADEAHAGKVLDRRFKKTYHPAWSAAFILDPLYLVKDASGKYLPQFKSLTPEQEKDVDKLITRMVSREEAHIALMELMKWRTEGLDPLYAQAVQVKQLDPATGKMKIANPQSSRLVWETCLSEFKSLGKVAVRLIFLHATSCGVRWNLSPLRSLAAHGRSRASVDRAHKLVFVAAHSKLERRDFSNDEDKDLELFTNGDDDVLSETSPFAEASSL